METEFTSEERYKPKTDMPLLIEESRIYAMILAAVGVIVAAVSYVQCCLPISIFGLALSFFAYRKSMESGNGLAKNLSIVGMAIAAIQIVILILIVILYVVYFAFMISALSSMSHG
jgi:hypothetical protein